MVKRIMKYVGTAILCIVATASWADRLIVIPEGDTLMTGGFKAEYQSRLDSGDGQAMWANVGISRVEIEGARFQNYPQGNFNAISAQVSILPDTEFTPALAFGVRDFANRTSGKDTPYDGRAFYLSASKSVPVGVPLVIRNVKLHGGVGTGSLSGVFVGAEGTIPLGIHLSAEYDSKRINFGAQYRVLPVLGIEANYIHSHLYYGAQFSAKL